MALNDELIRILRGELAYRGISARRLAQEIGMTEGYLSTRMTGAVEFRTSDLERIAAFLGMTVGDLLPEPEPTGGTR